jgi:hypothetical protein
MISSARRDPMTDKVLEFPWGLWLQDYKESHRDLLASDPDFARWLDEEYLPIAGGWMY